MPRIANFIIVAVDRYNDHHSTTHVRARYPDSESGVNSNLAEFSTGRIRPSTGLDNGSEDFRANRLWSPLAPQIIAK